MSESPGKTESLRLALSGVSRRTAFLILRSRAFGVAAFLSLIWLGGVIAYAAGFFGLFESAVLTPRSASALEIALFILAGLAPITLFFYGAMLAHKAEEIRVETTRLTAAIDALTNSVAPRAVPTAGELASALTVATRQTLSEEKEAMAAALVRLDAALAETQSMMDKIEGRESQARRAAKRTAIASATDTEQPGLPFGGDGEIAPATSASIPWVSVVRALDFPADEKDESGFEALRLVVEDREFAELLQAAEDVLTLMAEEGLYMEDLQPEIAPVSDWKRYADGARGREIDRIGGIDDEVALAITRGRMRNDPIFRDAALHFMRRFDRLAHRMATELGEDPMILEAADSRTGRAFMIVARVAGVFD